MRYKLNFKSGRTLSNILVTPEEDNIQQKCGWYIDINAAGWNAIKSTLGSQLEHVGKGSKNT